VLAIAKVAVLRGGWLTVKRLVRCHGAHAGEIDYP
jgi:putative component of membrane protein insertase Oxa1/YidC/SpoIIIJ protein YidD